MSVINGSDKGYVGANLWMSYRLYLPLIYWISKPGFFVFHIINQAYYGFKLNNIQPVVTKGCNLELYNCYYHKMGSRVWPNSETPKLAMVTDLQELLLLIINL